MGGKVIDVTGFKYGLLTVIERAVRPSHLKSQDSYWLCECSCIDKKRIIVGKTSLRSGNTKSCGCLNQSIITKHGMSTSRIMDIYAHMKQRCYNSKSHNYEAYGGRGITVCEAWLNSDNGFNNFYKWALQNGYDENLTIDRVDVNGNYEPNNCRWANAVTQANNRRNTIYLTIEGETKTIGEWAKENNLNTATLRGRIKMGWQGESLLDKKGKYLD